MDDGFLQILSGTQAGKRIKVGSGLTLGRSTENAVCFSGTDGALVSSRHAVIEKQGFTLVLRDLGSTNGTFIDGERISEHALQPDEVIGLGAGGPKLRVVSSTPLASHPASANPSQRGMSPSQRPREKPPGPPKRSNSDAFFGGDDAGEYTMGLAQRLKDDEAGHDEMKDLIKDKGRAARIVRTGALSKREARMIHSAAAAYSSHRRRALWITLSITGVATVVVGFLAYQNIGYRGKLKEQQNLLGNVRSLEHQLAEAGQKGPAETDEEKAALVSKLRAAERQLVSVRSNLKSQDVINTYKNPLGREIHTILEGFGKRDYIVPDIFINQVEKHIYTFTKTSTRSIMDRSLANKRKYQRIIEDELTRQSMPLAFFYLSMHESLLDSAIVSRSGARGLWQFMPQTGRDYGLRVPENWQNLPADADERTNPVLSTRAGVKYVKTLYAEFGDVALAMAAYNAGEGRIRKALRSIDDPVNNRDFWYIYRMGILADETNEYVPKIIATMIVDKNRARYGFPP